MPNEVIVQVPSTFQPLFFKEDATVLPIHLSIEEGIRQNPLYFELIFFSRYEKCEKPWEKWDEAVQVVLDRFKEIQEEIAHVFRERNREQIEASMKEGLSLFILALHWLNETYVSSCEIPPSFAFSFKPINVEERLAFCLENVTLIHSFQQLIVLFSELEKIYYKRLVIAKKKEKSGDI